MCPNICTQVNMMSYAQVSIQQRIITAFIYFWATTLIFVTLTWFFYTYTHFLFNFMDFCNISTCTINRYYHNSNGQLYQQSVLSEALLSMELRQNINKHDPLSNQHLTCCSGDACCLIWWLRLVKVSSSSLLVVPQFVLFLTHGEGRWGSGLQHFHGWSLWLLDEQWKQSWYDHGGGYRRSQNSGPSKYSMYDTDTAGLEDMF